MSNMSNGVEYVRRVDDEYSGGGFFVPTDVQVVEITLYPNGGTGQQADNNVFIKFNNDNSSSNYTQQYRRYLVGTGYGVAAYSPYAGIYVTKHHSGTGTGMISRVLVYPRGTGRYNNVVIYWADDYTNDSLFDSYGMWKNTVDEITSIGLGQTIAGRLSYDYTVKFTR